MFQLQKHLPKWRRRCVEIRWRIFDKKLKISYCSDYPIIFKFSYDINMYFGITNRIADFRFQRSQEMPYWNINCLHGVLHSSSFMFPLSLLPVEVQNTICKSLPTIWTKSDDPNHTKFGSFWQKPVYYVNLFWKIASAILKEVLHDCETINDA